MLDIILALDVIRTAAPERPAAATAAPAAEARSLEALPNTKIRYYDVAGANLGAVNQAIAAAAPRDPVTRAPSVSSSQWDVTVRFEQTISDGKCAVTAARAVFAASVSLPQLASEKSVPSELRRVWDQYVSVLKANEAAGLWFVHDRLGEIEKEVMSSSCDGAGGIASAAAERIKREQAKFVRLNKQPTPSIKVPVRDENDPRG